ncbi:hypothetical protein CASFOL_008157 [Castilleja foliolosa]|uniref:BAH domain-containing protein n=1 Tax=Castilleja foliolosa TaxID=1961234 RepID=A0ABD3DZ75_9LAMI
MSRFSKSGTPLAEIPGSSQQNSNIVWLGETWLCDKQLKHFPAFSNNGTHIPVYSFVRISNDEEKASLGYVEDLFEDQTGEKMVRLRPFLFGKDIDKTLVPKRKPILSQEVLITSTELEITAKHIKGPAHILTPGHYNKCSSQSLSAECFVCHRQIKNNNIKPFGLSKLPGYNTQPIISSMKRWFQKPIILALENVVMPEQVAVKGETSTGERLKSEPANKEHAESELPSNEKVEILSQDSGIRGCWFRCKVLRSTQKRLKVQYCDLTKVDEPGMLEEWVPKGRVANPDKLGMRCGGRLRIRPWPEWGCSSDFIVEVGAAVDVWWCDGWWEGVITRCDVTSSNNKLQVYLPGENNFLDVERKCIRVSKDWVNDQWVDIRAKPDIMPFLKS